MKIDVNKIPAEGLILEEKIPGCELQLDTEAIKFQGALSVKAQISRITNAVTINLKLSGLLCMCCSRCLKEFCLDFNKDLQLNYPVDNRQYMLDINPDIREEVILDYPLKPLCSKDCKGLCYRCGGNLNEGGCSCATT